MENLTRLPCVTIYVLRKLGTFCANFIYHGIPMSESSMAVLAAHIATGQSLFMSTPMSNAIRQYIICRIALNYGATTWSPAI